MDETSSKNVDSDAFRQVMGRFASGVTVVAARWPGGALHAMTANAFLSASLRPPLCVVSVAHGARMHACLTAADAFSISVLGRGQEEISNHFAGRSEKGRDAAFEETGDVPVLDGAIAQVVARKWAVHGCGDHDLFVGEVTALRSREGDPLLYYDRQYGGFSPAEAASEDIPPVW